MEARGSQAWHRFLLSGNCNQIHGAWRTRCWYVKPDCHNRVNEGDGLLTSFPHENFILQVLWVRVKNGRQISKIAPVIVIVSLSILSVRLHFKKLKGHFMKIFHTTQKQITRYFWPRWINRECSLESKKPKVQMLILQSNITQVVLYFIDVIRVHNQSTVSQWDYPRKSGWTGFNQFKAWRAELSFLDEEKILP